MVCRTLLKRDCEGRIPTDSGAADRPFERSFTQWSNAGQHRQRCRQQALIEQAQAFLE